MISTTFLIKKNLWDTQYRLVTNNVDAAVELLGLNPTEIEVTATIPATDQDRLVKASIQPLSWCIYY